MSAENPIRREPTELSPGTLVGDYRVESKLGEGGMSSVYAAVHPVIGKKAAIKVIDPALSANTSAVERFVQEAKAVNHIAHPNIVDIFSIGTLPDGRPYLIMEWLQGQSLGDRLEFGGTMPFHEGLEILLQLSQALQAAHEQGIIHRDLKPDNVYLVAVPGGRLLVKLLDFGVAKLSRSPTGTRTREGFTVGTPGYASPEQGRGVEVTAESDIYSLGALAWDLFVGRPPFRANNPMDLMVQHLNETAPNPRSFRPDLPDVLEALMVRMLAKDPAERPTLAEIIAVAEQLVSTPFVEPLPAPRRVGRWFAVGGVGVLAVVAVVMWITRLGREAPAAPPPGIASPPPAIAPAPAPAPPPAPAKPGSIVLVVDAPDAEVELDGRKVDASGPLVVPQAGPHHLVVTAPGRRPFEKHVDVSAGETVELHVQLPPLGKRATSRPKPPRSETYTLDPFGGKP